jgi:signal transduction histidine kinase
MIREYGTLREVIYQLIADEAEQVSLQDLGELSNLLLGGICDAAERFAADREGRAKQKSAEQVGFVAHELRNPLASAQMALMLMRRQDEIAPDSRLARLVERSLTRIGELVGDSMMGARLEGSEILQNEKIDLGELLTDLVGESDSDVEAKHLAIDVAGAAGVTIENDRKVLSSAFSNLIRNAVKFTREGRAVQVRVNRHDRDITVEVEDECGGIPSTKLETIFDPFIQIGADRSGYGLGLAIAKQAVEACGGSLGVRNLPGKGCVFSVGLPANVPPQVG